MKQHPTRTVLALMGPTASGKTELALQLADRFKLALISVDSAMIYRGMDVGTSKPDNLTLQRHPHAMIDILDPEDDYSVREFVTRADEAVIKAFADGQTPLLVGGTMLYFRRFLEGVAKLPSRNSKIRSRLRRRAAEEGVTALYKQLQEIDRPSALRIHPNNYSRIERALEVYLLTGISMSEHIERSPSVSVVDRLQCRYVEFGLLNLSRLQLHERIEKRVHTMLDMGFVDEVKTLMQRPLLTSDAMSMRAVGYRQLWDLLASNFNATVDSSIIDAIVAGTRQLARRQLTWLRNWQSTSPTISLQSPDAFSCMAKVLENYHVSRQCSK